MGVLLYNIGEEYSVILTIAFHFVHALIIHYVARTISLQNRVVRSDLRVREKYWIFEDWMLMVGTSVMSGKYMHAVFDPIFRNRNKVRYIWLWYSFITFHYLLVGVWITNILILSLLQYYHSDKLHHLVLYNTNWKPLIETRHTKKKINSREYTFINYQRLDILRAW